MRAVIICSGTIQNYDYISSLIRSDDTVICADGGYDHAVKMKIKPDVVLGDMDSVTSDYSAESFEKFPVEKDWTDGEIAVDYAIKHGFDEVIMTGCTGSRADHTLSNIFLLKKFADNNISAAVIDDNNTIYMPNCGMKLHGKKGDIVSVVPIGSDVTGYTTKGMYYEVENITLGFGTTIGNSNCMLSDECELSWKTGRAVVIKTHD